MLNRNRCAKINVKVLIIVIIVTVALGASLFAARQIRRTLLSKMSLNAGNAAFEKKDWPAAYKNFQEYLGRNPDDVEILRKYAKARLSIRPIEGPNLNQAVAGYRRILQLDPSDQDAYDELIKLYSFMRNFQELAYIARNRIADDQNDWKATLKLAEALFGQNKTKDAKEELEKLIKDINDIDADLPEKHIEEYVRSCALMSQIILADISSEDKTKALKWLDQAVDYAPESPESVEAWASRARFYRAKSQIPGQSVEDVKSNLALALKDLEKTDALGTEDPRIRLFLAEEWIAHGELDLAGDELQAADSLVKNLPQEKLEEYFFDINEWTVARFLLASRLAGLKGDAAGAVVLVDDALKTLKDRRYRAQVLPTAIMLYVVDPNRVLDANECLDEYVDAIYTQQGQSASRRTLPYFQALVARAEGDRYGVINALQRFVTSGASSPEVWGLLAEAFIRTDQNRRAVNAIIQYLRIRPQDPKMTLLLAKEYLKLGDWNKAFEKAKIAESLNPTDVDAKLLRIEANINISAEDMENNTPDLQSLANELAQLRTENSDRVDIRILQAIVAVHLNKPEEAEKELKQAIEECEKSLRAEIQLVRFYRREKRMPEAISACQVACERNPEVAEPWLSLSNLHVANSDYDSALSCLRKALDAVVGKWEKRSISMNLALLELMHGDRDEGINILSDMAAQDKREIRARTLLLATREIQENQDRAQELIDELKDAEGDSGLQWRLHQANIWLASDEWKAKQQDITGYLQYCIDADPQWSAPVLLMVNIYEKLNDLRRVEDICRQALVRNPSATDIAQQLVLTLQRQGRLSEAEKMLEQTELDARFTSALNIGTALQTGDFLRAIDELELRVSNDDQDARSRIQLAQLIYKQNADVNEALAKLDEAEAITPGSAAISAAIIWARVSILKAEGQDEEARQILNNYVVDSNSYGAYMMRAVYLANKGELERAEQDYRKLTTFTEQQGGAIGYEPLANFYAGTEQIDKAIEALEEGLNAYPEDLRLKRGLMKLLFMRAKAQDNAQDKERAIEILAALEKQLPEDPDLMKLRALQEYEKRTPESLKAARDKLEDVIKSEPTAIDAHLVLIRMAMQEKEYENARNYAIRALGSNPNNSALLSARGWAELALENYQMAAELAKLVLQKDPNSTEARDVLVSAALEIKDRSLLEQARTLIESGLGSGPADEQLLISRARVMVALESPQTAIPELKAYCQTEEGSGSVAALVTLANLYRLSGDFDQAKSWIEQAEQIDPNSQTALHARFIWLVAQKRYEELEDISSAYISAKEQNPTTVLTAALVLTALDSITLKKEGLKLYEHAVTLSPTSKDARLGLASTLYQTGDTERAKNTYQELLKQYPNDIQSLNDLAWILQEHDHNYEAAMELANKGLRNQPDEPHLLDTRGTILSNMPNRLADAKRDFQRLVELSSADTPQQAKALLQLGRICAKLNDLDQAKQHMKNALEIDQKINILTPDERSEITRILQ